MEHIVQFGVSIDDEYIRKYVIENAERKLLEKLTEEVKETITGENKRYQYADRVMEYANKVAIQFYDEHKDEIIDKAATKIADKLVKTKAVKSMLEETLNQI